VQTGVKEYLVLLRRTRVPGLLASRGEPVILFVTSWLRLFRRADNPSPQTTTPGRSAAVWLLRATGPLTAIDPWRRGPNWSRHERLYQVDGALCHQVTTISKLRPDTLVETAGGKENQRCLDNPEAAGRIAGDGSADRGPPNRWRPGLCQWRLHSSEISGALPCDSGEDRGIQVEGIGDNSVRDFGGVYRTASTDASRIEQTLGLPKLFGCSGSIS
jgi:hypothetical protein